MNYLASEQNHAHAIVLSEQYLDGAADAAFGQLPRFADEEYLAGYIATLKGLPTNPDGTIAHYTPRSQFALGEVDSPDPACTSC
ncbi:MAG: hypothetical protein Kow00121_30420 [Elainellaceae cyanobacterium]